MHPHTVYGQDTFDLRDQIHSDDQMHLHAQHAQAHHTESTYSGGTSDEEHSVLEDDSDIEFDEHGNPIHLHQGEDYLGDGESDISSSLSIPNESIDFDLVYAIHSFKMSVEGQATVVKGDSLVLMDDSNSYWWLVRVLKTQDVGYIPAENIETPFERLARLNKHRNVDLAAANEDEIEDDAFAAQQPRDPAIPRRGVAFTPALSVHRYPPAIWNRNPDLSGSNSNDPAMQMEAHMQQADDPMADMEESDGEWDDEPYSDEDPELAEEQRRQQSEAARASRVPDLSMEPDDGMGWELDLPGKPTATTLASIPTTTTRTGPVDDLVSTEPRVSEPINTTGPLLPSAIMQQQDEERKRTRDEIEQLERGSKKWKSSSSSASATKDKERGPVSSTGPNKLRKESKTDTTDDELSSKDNGSISGKKKKGVFGRLFGGKEKSEKKGIGSTDSAGSGDSRNSADSGRSSSVLQSNESVNPMTKAPMSPTTLAAKKHQRLSLEIKRRSIEQQQQPVSQQQVGSVTGVGLASQLRQRDQQQQALYQQYLNRSPSSPPEQSYGLQSASAVLPLSSYKPTATSETQNFPTAHRPRPGSLILTGNAADGQPELNVIRIFAGQGLDTEATFKTVLLSSSTTSFDLVQQAIQRFRLPPEEDASNYFLTVKQAEGSTAVLRPHEHPLTVFETLVEAAEEMPKVKRSSVGSINSITSNLSMHPAIRKLSMNDFTDDSAVKFYLNRRKVEHPDEENEYGDETLMAEDHSRNSYLSAGDTGVAQDRFSSPLNKFAMQVIIYPGDLPDDMVFDPMTEAIVFKHTLRDRGQANVTPAGGVSQVMRRKIFLFPKNVTVGEVIELGLERFGILEGVVDGGDEVEDKQTKRRSIARVRYMLAVAGEKERHLSPSSKVIDAYQRPPIFRSADRRSVDNKRRSVDSNHLLGHIDDLQPDDPVFMLRRAVQYRNSFTRHRNSAPLDEIALQRMQRESTASSTTGSDVGDEQKARLSKQHELIAAQRAASKATQKALLSAQNNSVRGVDILLPGNTALRSSRYDTGDRVRYSYIQDDDEYDISDIINEEWQDDDDPHTNDILQGAMRDNNRGLGDKLDRILSKIQDGKAAGRVQQRPTSQIVDDSKRSTLSSVYSTSTADPQAVNPVAQEVPASFSTTNSLARLGLPTGSGIETRRPRLGPSNVRQQSFASLLSEGTDGYATPATHLDSPSTSPAPLSPGTPQSVNTVRGPADTGSTPYWDNDDFGFSTVMAIIETRALSAKPQTTPAPVLDPVDEMLFGPPLDLKSLHPKLRDVYADAFKEFEEIDRALDRILQQSLRD